MVKRETEQTKQSLVVLPAAHCAANGDNGIGFSNSNKLFKVIKELGLSSWHN